MNQDEIDRWAIDSLLRDLPFAILVRAVEIIAMAGLICLIVR